MPLPLRRRAARDADRAVVQDTQRNAFEWSEAGSFHIGRNAQSDIAALFARFALPLPETAIGALLQCGIEACRIIAAVINDRFAVTEGKPDRIRHLRGLNEIAAP